MTEFISQNQLGILKQVIILSSILLSNILLWDFDFFYFLGKKNNFNSAYNSNNIYC